MLYQEDQNLNSVPRVAFTVKTSKNNILWHNRLGHPLNTVVKNISGLDIVVCNDFLYESCPLAKQTRMPFHKSNSVTTNVFDLIHVDIGDRINKPA